MRAIRALGRRTLYLQSTWAACGAGNTGTAAALFVFGRDSRSRAYRYNNYYDLQSMAGSQYS
jgi:hypothetical protein